MAVKSKQLGLVGYDGNSVVKKTAIINVSPEDLRTLGSVPVVIVPAPGDNKIVVPELMSYSFIKVGTAPFSGFINMGLRMPLSGILYDWNNFPLNAFDGSAAMAAINLPSTNSLNTVDYATDPDAINSPLYLAAQTDRTGGDGCVFTLILPYQIVDVTGLI